VRTGDAESGIKKIFDADKVQKEIEAQTKITQVFGQQASKVVGDYVQEQRTSLQEQLKNASEADKTEVQTRISELSFQERVMNVLIGAVSGMGESALTKESLSAAAEEMRRITLENSAKFSGITDGETILTNLSGKSLGVRGDLKKEAGNRVNLDSLCGTDNRRCVINEDKNGRPILDANGKTQLAINDQGLVEFDSKKEKKTLAEYLESEEGKNLSGVTGGIQGWKGTLFGTSYVAGSWQDKLMEAFSGTHDFIGGQLSGLCDAQGNIKRGRSDAEKIAQEVWSGIAIIPATPFAMAELLSPQMWQAISILLEGAK
jgi:filamentous hemagglutinin